MKNQKQKTLTASATFRWSLLLLSLGVIACGPKDSETAALDDAPAETGLSLMTATLPAEALSVIEARAQLKPGDAAVVQGQIGGVMEPFLSGYAGFVLGDTEIVFCNEMSDAGHCPTPWDACCEDKEQLQGRRVLVQFIDGAGMPIKADLQKAYSLNELDAVAVVGTVAESSTPENMVIYAKQMKSLEQAMQ